LKYDAKENHEQSIAQNLYQLRPWRDEIGLFRDEKRSPRLISTPRMARGRYHPLDAYVQPQASSLCRMLGLFRAASRKGKVLFQLLAEKQSRSDHGYAQW
jgi:hypothetical protein